MSNSDVFVATNHNGFNGFDATFANNYLLKHGNIFLKPESNGYVFSIPTGGGQQQQQQQQQHPFGIYGSRSVPSPCPGLVVIKEEKPPTPPATISPTLQLTSSPPPNNQTSPPNGTTKNTWILGNQKLSWDNSTVASYNPETKMFRCVVCNAVGFLSRIAEHYLGTHTSAKVFQCLHCPYSSTWSRCVRMHMAKHHGVPNAPPSLWKGQPLLEEIFQLLTNLKTTVDSQGRERLDPELCDKKFICPKCPYTTDRRDLYLRHENIHKEDKPYHCYICFKLFNRADHVKKHFLRIHRGHPYDISLVRRRPPRSSSFTSTSWMPNGGHSFSTEPPACATRSPLSGSLSGCGGPESVKDQDAAVAAAAKAAIKQPKTFDCPFCAWEGVDAWCLRRHMNSHVKPFSCPVCEYKSAKAERLFTHVYKAHKKLVCTKCNFVTDKAMEFESHIKDCCLEITLGNPYQKLDPKLFYGNLDDSPNDSDASNSGMKSAFPKSTSTSIVFPNDLSITPVSTSMGSPATSTTTDVKGSISIIPLHNSVSYCFPSRTPDVLRGLSTVHASIPDVVSMVNGGINGETRDASRSPLKPTMDIKQEMASPTQSSSESCVTDLTSDPNDVDITCWHCGCEFADESSLQTHTELYHRENAASNLSCNSSHFSASSASTKGLYSCVICSHSCATQQKMMEHMRFHTGQVLRCRAGRTCSFTTTYDSTLLEHVIDKHNDGIPRCPHCGLPCLEKRVFALHYRKCHHASACRQCRDLKEIFSYKRDADFLQPYLTYNPYSRTTNTIMPYTSLNSALSNLAAYSHLRVQSVNGDMNSDSSGVPEKSRRSRKQSSPRKLLHHRTTCIDPSTSGETPSQDSGPLLCDKNSSNDDDDKDRKTFLTNYTEKLLKLAERPLLTCRLCYKKPLCYKNNVNFLLHCLWFHLQKKFKCKICGARFRYKYQVLIHERKDHRKKFGLLRK